MVVVVIVVVVVVFVVTLVPSDVVLVIGVVVTVVVLILMAFGCLFSVEIVTIPAMHVATNIANQIMMLQVLLLWP